MVKLRLKQSLEKSKKKTSRMIFSAVGTAVQLKEYSAKTKRKWTLGIKLSPALE